MSAAMVSDDIAPRVLSARPARIVMVIGRHRGPRGNSSAPHAGEHRDGLAVDDGCPCCFPKPYAEKHSQHRADGSAQ